MTGLSMLSFKHMSLLESNTEPNNTKETIIIRLKRAINFLKAVELNVGESDSFHSIAFESYIQLWATCQTE